jgi:hypothetical protein
MRRKNEKLFKKVLAFVMALAFVLMREHEDKFQLVEVNRGIE